ncbi:MAG: hypothetical protein RLZZ385_2427 [Pseudomonadota bacterium]|jgi:probable DNA repair protein
MPATRIDLDNLLGALRENRLILVPNHVTANAIQHSWAANQSAAIYLQPQVLPVDIWLRDLWDQLASRGCQPFAATQLLQTRQEKLLWNRIIENDPAASPLLHTGATAQLASQAYQLARQWLVTEQQRRDLSNSHHIPDVGRFIEWQKAFESFCASHGLSSLADAIPPLLRAMEQGLVSPELAPLLVNFLEPPPLYAGLFQWLEQHWQARRVQTWPGAGEGLEFEETASTVRRYGFEQAQDELAACAAWAAALHSRQPQAHIGIVVADVPARAEALEQALLRYLQPQSVVQLGERSRPFTAFSDRHSLTQVAMIDHALRLLGLNFDTQHSLDLVQLLRSPYIHCAATAGERDAACTALEARLRRRGETSVRLAEVRRLLDDTEDSAACPALSGLLLHQNQLFREHRQKQQLAAHHWTELFGRQLLLWGWPGKPLSDAEQQALLGWQSTLDSFRQISAWMGDLTLSTALTALRQLLMDVSLIAPPQLQHSISLLTPAEASGLHFDHLWILDTDDRHWPQRRRLHPLLPYRLQASLGMPGSNPDTDYRHSEALLSGLHKATAGEWVVSAVSLDGERRLRATPLLRSLPVDPAPAIAQGSDWATGIPVPAQEEIPDTVLLPLGSEEQPKGGARLLTNHLLCPYRAFAEHRLQCQPLQAPVSGLPPATRGKAVHLALQHFYERVPDQAALTGLVANDLEQAIEDAVNSAVDWLKRAYPHTMTPRFSRVEASRLGRLLRDFLQLERRRPPFSLIATEQSLQCSPGDLPLSLTIDRIDRLADGSLLLMDYKTSAYIGNRQWSATNPDDLQLALYHWAITAGGDGPVSGAVIAHLRAGSLDYRGVVDDSAGGDWLTTPRKATPWPELAGAWQDRVTATARQFMAGDITVRPLDGSLTCRHCGRQSLCRIEEQLPEDNDGDKEETGDPGQPGMETP